MPNPHYSWPEHALTLTGAPDPIMSLSDAKAHLRVDFSDDDAYITGLVSVAGAMLDGPNGMVGKAMLTQTWTLHTGRYNGPDRLAIPVLPFRSVTSLKYYDADNVQQTADVANDYTVFANEDFGYIEPKTAWPAMYDRPDAVELIFAAGFGDATEIPKNISHAAKMLIAHWYENREDVAIGQSGASLPMAVESLVNISRIGWIKG